MPRKSSKKTKTTPEGNALGERLQKLLAAAGLGSRRECEEFIVQGRVEVDRKVVDALGAKADPHTQEIRFDGEVLRLERKVYYLVNKPPGVLSTNRDPSGRTRVIDLAPDKERLFTVGRLDSSSAGLILLTNDGELANRIAHPRYQIEKIYHVEVAGTPAREDLQKLRQGIHLAEAFVRVERLRVKQRLKKSTLLEIILQEGKNREIRRMLARLGHKVLKLTRIAIGPLRLGDMPPGAFRELDSREIRKLKALLRGEGPAKAHAPRQREKKRRSKQVRPQPIARTQPTKTTRLPKTGMRQATVLAYDEEPATPTPGKKKRVRRERKKHQERSSGEVALSAEQREEKTSQRAEKGKRKTAKRGEAAAKGKKKTKKKFSPGGVKGAGRGAKGTGRGAKGTKGTGRGAKGTKGTGRGAKGTKGTGRGAKGTGRGAKGTGRGAKAAGRAKGAGRTKGAGGRGKRK